MKKNLKIKKLVTVVTAAALVCGSSLTAFADWPSFQKDVSNNGYVVQGADQEKPLITGPTADDKTLPIQAIDLETEGYPFVGVDAETVISGDYAYTIYNGGTVANGKGGTRMRATNLADGSEIWDRQIFPSSNVEQLATPVIDGTTIYAAINEDSSLFSSDSLSGTVEFGATADITIASGLEVPSNLEGIQVSTNLSYTPASGSAAADSITGQIVLVNTEEEGAEPISLGENEYYGGNMIFYNLSGTVVSKGTYDLKLQVTNKTAEGNTLTLTTADVTIPTWDLVKITGITSQIPSVAYLTSGPTLYDDNTYQGYGEPDTPLKIFGNMLYFGISDGDRCYYQYDISKNTSFNSGTAKRFVPGNNNDFYWAGAAAIDSGNYIVFGSDAETLYVQKATDFSNVNEVELIAGKNTVGAVRSSVVIDVNAQYAYFTSQGGYLWRIPVADLTAEEGVPEEDIVYVNLADGIEDVTTASSVSTPAITDDGTVYVGYSAYEGTNEVGGVWIGKSDTSGVTYTADIPVKAPVNASPLVYSEGTTDYVYFTTNSSSGAGYCWKVTDGVPDTAETWTVGSNPNAGSYTLQGMSIGADGTLVFGNDLEKLYVIPSSSQTPPESETTAESGEASEEAGTEAAAE